MAIAISFVGRLKQAGEGAVTGTSRARRQEIVKLHN
jgi:hypothetical protein